MLRDRHVRQDTLPAQNWRRTGTNVRVLSSPVRENHSMDRASLKQLLEQGLSLAEIGRRFGRHEVTVAYWMRKHGLQAAHRERHGARGSLVRAELESLVEREMSIAEIAATVNRSRATVRYWLAHYGLKTYAQQGRLSERSTRAARAAGKATVMRDCRRHGVTEFWLEGRGYYRCKRCRMDRVNQRRRKIKRILVAEAGGCARSAATTVASGRCTSTMSIPAASGFI